MSFVQFCATLIICSATILIFSHSEKELTIIISSSLYIIVMIFIMTRIEDFINKAIPYIKNIEFLDFDLFLKICGLIIISSISITICENLEQKGIASAIELIATVEMLILFLPLIKEFIGKILYIIGE